MIAYVNRLLTTVFGNNVFAIRLGAILIVLLISWIIYLAAKELFDRKTATMAVIIFNLLPTFFAGGIFLVPQTVFFLFWTLSFYLLIKIVKTAKPFYWYLLAVAVGLGLLSDFVMGLFFIGTFVFLLLVRELRFWFAKKEPYLAFLLALIIFSPVVIWNLKHGLPSLLSWGGKMGGGPNIGANLLNFFGLQMLLYTPPIFLLTIYMVFRQGWQSWRLGQTKNLLLAIFSASVFLPFAALSPIINIGGHWPATAYLPTILAAPRAKRITLSLIISFALFVNIIGFAYYLYGYPTPAELKGQEFSINQQLPEFLKKITPAKGRTFYVANNLGILGLISFHGNVKAHVAPGRLAQVDLWGKPELKKGDNVIYFALGEPGLYDRLKPLFKEVRVEQKKRLFTKDADIPNKTQIFHCHGFIGGTLP